MNEDLEEAEWSEWGREPRWRAWPWKGRASLICAVPQLRQNFPVFGKVGVRLLGVVMTHLFHTHI